MDSKKTEKNLEKNQKPSLQKVPEKPKKKNSKLLSSELEKIQTYYNNLETFYTKNEEVLKKKIETTEFICCYDDKEKKYLINHKNGARIETFGFIQDKKQFLNAYEVIYLYENGKIKFANELNIEKLYNECSFDVSTLYSYLRRNGNILSFYEDNAIVVFKEMENFKSFKVDFIVFPYKKENEINFYHVKSFIDKGNEILNFYFKKSKNNYSIFSADIVIAFIDGLNRTFIKINDKNVLK